MQISYFIYTITVDWFSFIYNKVFDSASTNPLLEHGNPISGLEPTMALDVVDVVPQIAVPLGQINLQQIPQQVLQVRAEVRWETDLTQCQYEFSVEY